MALRIDCADVEGGGAICVAGELGADGAAELENLLCRCRSSVTIDLENLVSADAASVAVLRGLGDKGARLVGASRYIRMVIDRDVGRSSQPGAGMEDA